MTSTNPFQHVRFFQGLDDAALTVVQQKSYVRRVSDESFFFQQDEPATTFYVLTAGQAHLSQVTIDGQQVILGFLGPDQEVGIVAAIQHAEYPLSLQAVTDCVALAWDAPTLQSLMENYPILALRALRMVTGRFVQLQQQYRELATERVERRIARVLLRLSAQAGQPHPTGVRIEFPLSRQDVAEMTGTTLYTVSRTLSQWEKLGIVTTGRELIIIRSPQELLAIADDIAPDKLTDP